MAGGETSPAEGGATAAPLRLIRDLARISSSGFSGFFKKDCSDLARRVSLLAHLLEEIRDSKKFREIGGTGSSSCNSFLSDLTMVLQAAKRLVFAANNFESSKVASLLLSVL